MFTISLFLLFINTVLFVFMIAFCYYVTIQKYDDHFFDENVNLRWNKKVGFRSGVLQRMR